MSPGETDFWNRTISTVVWFMCAVLAGCALLMVAISGMLLMICFSAVVTEHWIYAIPLGFLWAWLTVSFRKIAREKGL